VLRKLGELAAKNSLIVRLGNWSRDRRHHGIQLKSISKAGIPEAIAKVELYRYLNEPEEAESICRDILALIPGISSLAACSVSPSLTSLSAPPAIDIPRCSPSFRASRSLRAALLHRFIA